MNIFSELETEYNYTHNELLMAKYVLTCIVYEASKIFLLTIIFYLFFYLFLELMAVVYILIITLCALFQHFFCS